MAAISGGIGQASKQMMQELQKQTQNVEQNSQVSGGQFKDNLAQTQKVSDVQKVQEIQKTAQMDPSRKTGQVLQTAVKKGAGIENASQAKAVAKTEKTKGKGFRKMLNGLVKDQNKLDEIIKMSLSGKKFNQQELLGIQASVYKFSQELEMTSKVVEKATSGVKQTMQTQV